MVRVTIVASNILIVGPVAPLISVDSKAPTVTKTFILLPVEDNVAVFCGLPVVVSAAAIMSDFKVRKIMTRCIC